MFPGLFYEAKRVGLQREIEETMLSSLKKPCSSLKEIKSRPDWRVSTKDRSAHRNQTVRQTKPQRRKTTKAASTSL